VGSEYGIMYRNGPAFYTRRVLDGAKLGPEMLVPEILDYMLEEIPDDMTMAIVDSELKMLGTTGLEDRPGHHLKNILSDADQNEVLMQVMSAVVFSMMAALGLTQEVKVW